MNKQFFIDTCRNCYKIVYNDQEDGLDFCVSCSKPMCNGCIKDHLCPKCRKELEEFQESR